MDSLKFQRLNKSWYSKISWYFLIFLQNITNIQNKTENFSKIQLPSVLDSGFVVDPPATVCI